MPRPLVMNLRLQLGGETMSTTRSFALLAASALAAITAGCQKPAGGGNADPAAIKSAIQADEKKWNDEFKAKKVEALLGHYADDAFFVATGVPGASGSTEIRKAYVDGLSENYFSVSFASDKIDVAASGDLAYARGHFSQKYQDRKSGQIVSESGSYITVYRKQADGSWKAVEDFAAADPTTRKTASPVVKPAKMISF
jgi:uncharacterized protein (TIGR02246 family)